MYRSAESGRKVLNLAGAFKNDGWEIRKMITRSGRTGIAAENRQAYNYDTGKKKKLYYVEGTGYEMGFLIGSLAEAEVSSTAVDFANKVVFSFIGAKTLEKIKLIQEALIFIVYELSRKAFKELPQELKDEIQGIYDGCKSFNPKTRVNMEHLVTLNLGIDTLCSMIYSGDFSFRSIPGIEPGDLKVPLMCNAFAVFGGLAGGGHYFGRDFMFPTADVFQNTAAMIIQRPAETGGRRPLPFVSLTAPGMIGSISAMNVRGTGIGVDMSPAGNCTPGSIGVNSLLLNRLCAQYGDSAESMVELIRNTPRGVSWNYIIADGENDRACVVEAGSSRTGDAGPDNTPGEKTYGSGFLRYPPSEYLPLLPDSGFLDSHRSGEFQNGMMVRWNDFAYPKEYLGFNRGLWDHFNKKHSAKKAIYSDAFDSEGYINKNGADQNCPSMFYFAPQREEYKELVIATNHFVIPEMRYFSMLPWTSMIVGNIINDIQWRYDELNHEIAEILREKGIILMEDAKKLAGFLSPFGRFPGYYAGNPRSRDGKQIRIEGAASVFDLRNRVLESRYGYYCDEWTKVTLPNYL